MSAEPARIGIFIPPTEGHPIYRVEEASPQFVHALMEIWCDCVCVFCFSSGIPIYWYCPANGKKPTEYQNRIAAQILKSKYVQ